MASVGNILENPQIGLMFVDFIQSTVGLHLNGNAQVMNNDEMVKIPQATASLIEEANIGGGRHPECWIVFNGGGSLYPLFKAYPPYEKIRQTRSMGDGR